MNAPPGFWVCWNLLAIFHVPSKCMCFIRLLQSLVAWRHSWMLPLASDCVLTRLFSMCPYGRPQEFFHGGKKFWRGFQGGQIIQKGTQNPKNTPKTLFQSRGQAAWLSIGDNPWKEDNCHSILYCIFFERISFKNWNQPSSFSVWLGDPPLTQGEKMIFLCKNQ